MEVIELAFAQEGVRCWMCHDGLSTRARFCNHCGCIQPARELDHFQRLGVPSQLDVDLQMLERHFTSLQRSFAPERFVIRSHAEKTYAAKHREALLEAYETLRDPMRRSRYWLQIHEDKEFSGVDQPLPPVVLELQAVLEAAREATQLDRLAQRAGQEIEHGIMRLLNSLREQDWQRANETLSALDGLEDLITEVREKRQALTPHAGK
ncbi:MAG: Fe-S protein assembly co-chaperone HscB [Proteobacteria bacterium]|nr:Fe-S protein assembly co-chaperone HscB [Pseudomonadota bacterium]